MAPPGRVGLHGDGVRRRWVIAVDDNRFHKVIACFRRFWCPACGSGCLVGHPGTVPRIRAGLATVAAAVHAVVAPPLGEGLQEIEVQARMLGEPVTVPESERARAGTPRWNTLRRWVRTLERWWPSLTLVGVGFRTRAAAFVAAIGPGLPLEAFLEAAVQAHLRGGAVM